MVYMDLLSHATVAYTTLMGDVFVYPVVVPCKLIQTIKLVDIMLPAISIP
jgi:hypothetical protein